MLVTRAVAKVLGKPVPFELSMAIVGGLGGLFD